MSPYLPKDANSMNLFIEMESDDSKMMSILKIMIKNQRLLRTSVSFFIRYYKSLPNNV